MSSDGRKQAVIIGAGPAGLTAGVELLKTDRFKVKVLERDNIIGGLARTNDYKGYKFDIGPHHFITSDSKIEKWWKDLMGDDFIKLSRFTRIYYNKKYFNYPLNGINVIKNLNLLTCIMCVLSYVRYSLFPIKNVKSFEDWITNKFGYKLFSIFFKTYTEKVWGIPCNKISSDWAAQRIKGFSMRKAIFYAFFGKWFKKNAPRTLSDEFYYPPYGSGQLWEKVADNLTAHQAGELLKNHSVVSIEHKEGKITSVLTGDKLAISRLKKHEADYFFSTMPLKTLILSMDPLPPRSVIDSAKSLAYRGLITVNLIVDQKDIFPDHWLYIHDKDVLMGRIGNMSNFSDKMMADPNHSSLSLEYFTYVGGDLWNASESELVELGARELEKLNIVSADKVIDGMVIKTPEAYPVYDAKYQSNLKRVLDYLKQFSNLQLMGRNGLHRYNNMDIAMLSAMHSVDEVLAQEEIIIPTPEKVEDAKL